MLGDQLIRVLGPVDVLTPSGESVSVGGRQARAVLGALVIGVGHAVPIDHLYEALWGDDPPETAENTLQSYVSHLRHVIGDEVIVRIDHAYELASPAANIDAAQFEALLTQAFEARGDAERCQHLCREALHLWRGRPFGDLADDAPFELEVYRLEELRVAAMELSLEADLALGRHELVVGELEAAVQEHPYRERFWFLLIEALAGSGRRVESLRECARFRRVLAEVGVQPSDELRSVELQILGGHPDDQPAGVVRTE
jgi:DNA-binding SARP family transcriptional activator